MESVEDMEAGNFMNTDPITAQNDESISQIKNRMEEHNLRAIPIVDSKNQLEGVIGYRDLIRHVQFNPESTKPSKVMHQPPEFDRDSNLVEIADLRINSGRKMLVTTDKEKLSGVISDPELMDAMQEAEELKDVSTKDVETRDLVTVFEQDSLDEARHQIMDNNISRIPVLDKNGKLSGIVRSTDLLKMVVPREVQSSGGRSGNRHGTQEVNITGGGEKAQMSEIPVSELMKTDLNTSEDHLSGLEAVERMNEQGQDEIIFVEGDYPESIVTLKDFMDFIEGFAPGNTVLVNLTGLEMAEEKSAVHNQIRKQLQGSLGRKLHRPEELSLHVKKAEKDGGKHRYEINMKLYSEYGQLTINEEGWQLLDVVDEALNQLNEVVRREKEKMTEH